LQRCGARRVRCYVKMSIAGEGVFMDKMWCYIRKALTLGVVVSIAGTTVLCGMEKGVLLRDSQGDIVSFELCGHGIELEDFKMIVRSPNLRSLQLKQMTLVDSKRLQESKGSSDQFLEYRKNIVKHFDCIADCRALECFDFSYIALDKDNDTLCKIFSSQYLQSLRFLRLRGWHHVHQVTEHLKRMRLGVLDLSRTDVAYDDVYELLRAPEVRNHLKVLVLRACKRLRFGMELDDFLCFCKNLNIVDLTQTMVNESLIKGLGKYNITVILNDHLKYHNVEISKFSSTVQNKEYLKKNWY